MAKSTTSYSQDMVLSLYRESQIELFMEDYPAIPATVGSECNGL